MLWEASTAWETPREEKRIERGSGQNIQAVRLSWLSRTGLGAGRGEGRRLPNRGGNMEGQMGIGLKFQD